MIIGITGSIATGTSTAARHIAKGLKAGIISADDIAHAQIEKNSAFKKNLAACFGKDIMDAKNCIDRKFLAAKAFSNKTNHKRLCRIAYPIILKVLRSRLQRMRRQGIQDIVVDAPMLIESGLYKNCDSIIVVMASMSLQLERCMDKGISSKDALSRISLQLPLHKKALYADYIIDNRLDLEQLQYHCQKVVKALKGNKKKT